MENHPRLTPNEPSSAQQSANYMFYRLEEIQQAMSDHLQSLAMLEQEWHLLQNDLCNLGFIIKRYQNP